MSQIPLVENPARGAGRLTALSALFAFALLAAGCRTTRPDGQSPGAAGEDTTDSRGGAMRDVTVDGVSILCAWYAVEVVGDARATRDLAAGTLEQTLIVSSNGRAALTGMDRRAGGSPVTFSGRITGSRVRFTGMEGDGTLLLSGRRLTLRDPRGLSTIFVRSGS